MHEGQVQEEIGEEVVVSGSSNANYSKKFHVVTVIAIASSSSFATSLSAVNKFSHKF
jgi:hypothetical protein